MPRQRRPRHRQDRGIEARGARSPSVAYRALSSRSQWPDGSADGEGVEEADARAMHCPPGPVMVGAELVAVENAAGGKNHQDSSGETFMPLEPRFRRVAALHRPFVDREPVIAAFAELLRTRPGSSCVFNVVGVGGIGKSRLLQELKQRSAETHLTATIDLQVPAMRQQEDALAVLRVELGRQGYVSTVSTSPTPSSGSGSTRTCGSPAQSSRSWRRAKPSPRSSTARPASPCSAPAWDCFACSARPPAGGGSGSGSSPTTRSGSWTTSPTPNLRMPSPTFSPKICGTAPTGRTSSSWTPMRRSSPFRRGRAAQCPRTSGFAT